MFLLASVLVILLHYILLMDIRKEISSYGNVDVIAEIYAQEHRKCCFKQKKMYLVVVLHTRNKDKQLQGIIVGRHTVM